MRILDEIIKEQENVRKLQKDIHLNSKRYSPNMCIYFEQLEKDPNFNYIINSSPMQLFYDYERNLKHIAEMIYNPQFSNKQNVLNVLEYMRIMAMYENVKQKKEADFQIIELSRYPIFLSMFGKGVCYSQAKFTRDILLHMGINAVDFYIEIDNNYYKRGIPHQQTLLNLDNNYYFIDATDYNGTLDGIQFELQQQNKNKLESSGIRTDFSATQEEIKKSREFVLSKLIKELGIDQISKQLRLEDKEELYKQCVIMAYVETKINLTKNIETNIATANMNGVNIEVGKLIELFLHQNNYVEKKEGNVLISSLNAKMYKTYLHFINQARVDVLQASIKEICKVNHMEIDTFMQSPIQNMKKYAPEINIDPIAMKTLVKDAQDKVQKNREEKVAKINDNNGMKYEERKISAPSSEDFSDGR